MKNVLFILMVLLVGSCTTSSKEDKMMATMATKTKAFYEDYTFKKNQTIDWLEFEPVRVKTVDENFLDEVLRADLLEVLELRTESVKLLMESVELGMTSAIPDLEKALEKLRDVAREDSIIVLRIEERVDPKNVYMLQTFVKASIKDSKGNIEYNVLDTIMSFFDENLNRLELPEFESL